MLLSIIASAAQQFSVIYAEGCFVADAPRNDIAIIFPAIASPDARDRLHEAISDITVSPRIAVLSTPFVLRRFSGIVATPGCCRLPSRLRMRISRLVRL